MNSGAAGGNWVCFAFFGRWPFGIGFVSYNCTPTDWGEIRNPKLEISNWKRDATVGWALACNSSCLRCSIILNSAMHYTTFMPEKQVFMGRNEDFGREKAQEAQEE